MPAKDKHQEQYALNKKLLKNTVFQIDTSEHMDWVITIMFYCAIHLIEKNLANINLHSPTHEIRKSYVFKFGELKSIAAQYISLEIQSRRARYDCSNIKKSDVQTAIEYLEEIEKVAISS